MDKYCTSCGQELAPNSKFCTGCGVPLGRPSSFHASDTDTPASDHKSVSLDTPSIPPDVEKAMDDLNASIAELDRVMRGYGVEGVTEQFERPRQNVRSFILNNSGNSHTRSQSNKLESASGGGGFFFAGGLISTEGVDEEQEEEEEDENRWGWLGDLFG